MINKETRMDLIGGINLYSMRSSQITKELKERLGVTEQTQTTETTQTTNKEIASKDILNFMANQSVSMRIDVKCQNVGKITANEEYQRIEKMMKEFETGVDSGLQTFNGEFPNLSISDGSKMKVVLNSLERSLL